MISQKKSYNTEATLLKTLKQTEENIRIANGFHNAEFRIRPPLPTWNHFLMETWNPTLYLRKNVMDADPSLLGKQHGMLPQG